MRTEIFLCISLYIKVGKFNKVQNNGLDEGIDDCEKADELLVEQCLFDKVDCQREYTGL